MKRADSLAGRLRQRARAFSSWELLRALFPWSDKPTRLPMIASRETFTATGLFGGVNLLRKIPMPLRVIGGVLYVLALVVSRSANAPVCFNGLLLLVPLIALIPSLLMWAVPVALALAPLIAREREAQTWEVLRMTPFTTEEILLSKAQGALASLRRALRPLWQVQMQVLIALLVGGGTMVLLSGGLLETTEEGMLARQSPLCFGALLVVVAALAGYLLDRVQQFVLMAVTALMVSATTSSVRTASGAAIGAVLIAWGADVAVGVVLLLVQPPGEVYDLGFSLIAMVLLGPPIAYILELPFATVMLAVLSTLTLRAVAIRLLWRRVVRQAEQL